MLLAWQWHITFLSARFVQAQFSRTTLKCQSNIHHPLLFYIKNLLLFQFDSLFRLMIHFFHNFFWCISACIQHIPHPFQRPARQAALRLQRRLGGDLHRGRRALHAPSHAWLRGTKGYLPQSGGRNIAVKLTAKRMGKGCEKWQIHTKSVQILIWPVWSDVVYIFGIALPHYLLVFLFVTFCHCLLSDCLPHEMSWSWVWKAIFRFFEPTTGTGQWQSVASLDANCLVEIDRFKTFGRPPWGWKTSHCAVIDF